MDDWHEGCNPRPVGSRDSMSIETPRDNKDFRANNPFAKQILKKTGKCKYCNSDRVVRNGKRSDGIQQYLCKDCKHGFVNLGHHTKMRIPKEAIATALELYYDGLSLRKVAKHIQKIFKLKITHMTVRNWIEKYTPLVKNLQQSFKPKIGGIWHVDETAVKVNGEQWWYWEVIDRDTRLILGTHLSKRRYERDAMKVFQDAFKTTKELPSMVICDGLTTYYGGLKMALGGRTVATKIKFIQKAGICKVMPSNNNRIERYHNTLKNRINCMRGLKNPKQLLDGFTYNYNLIRPHQTFNTTPANIAGLKLPFEDGWGNLIDWATYYQTLSGSN